MKAKDYAKMYQSCLDEGLPERTAISRVLWNLCKELQELTQTRGKCTFKAAISCFDEIEKKWRAFTYLVPGWKPDGFILFVQHEMPDLWMLYQIGKQPAVSGYGYRRGK